MHSLPVYLEGMNFRDHLLQVVLLLVTLLDLERVRMQWPVSEVWPEVVVKSDVEETGGHSGLEPS